jgi:hypothetical protein
MTVVAKSEDHFTFLFKRTLGSSQETFLGKAFQKYKTANLRVKKTLTIIQIMIYKKVLRSS